MTYGVEVYARRYGRYKREKRIIDQYTIEAKNKVDAKEMAYTLAYEKGLDMMATHRVYDGNTGRELTLEEKAYSYADRLVFDVFKFI